jgi:hypothetical protein
LVEAARDSGLVTEITGQTHSFNKPVLLRVRADEGPRVILAAVVDEDDFNREGILSHEVLEAST